MISPGRKETLENKAKRKRQKKGEFKKIIVDVREWISSKEESKLVAKN